MAYRSTNDLSLGTIVLGLVAVLLILVVVETLLGLLFGTLGWFLGLFGPLGPFVALIGLLAIVAWALDLV